MKIKKQFMQRLLDGKSNIQNHYLDISESKFYEAEMKISWEKNKTLVIKWTLPDGEEIGYYKVENFSYGDTVEVKDLKILGVIKLDSA